MELKGRMALLKQLKWFIRPPYDPINFSINTDHLKYVEERF